MTKTEKKLISSSQHFIFISYSYWYTALIFFIKCYNVFKIQTENNPIHKDTDKSV